MLRASLKRCHVLSTAKTRDRTVTTKTTHDWRSAVSRIIVVTDGQSTLQTNNTMQQLTVERWPDRRSGSPSQRHSFRAVSSDKLTPRRRPRNTTHVSMFQFTVQQMARVKSTSRTFPTRKACEYNRAYYINVTVFCAYHAAAHRISHIVVLAYLYL